MIKFNWKKGWGLLKAGSFREIKRKLGVRLSHSRYTRRAVREDKKLSGISANHWTSSRFADQGAYDVQSSDYRCLKAVFDAVPLREDEVFVDLGCGEGRVLTYLYQQGFRGSLTGIELDPEAAGVAARRTAVCENVRVLQGNVLDQGEVFSRATVVYLFNPFDQTVLRQFLDLLERVHTKPVRLYYLNDLYASELEQRKGWTCLHRGTVSRPYIPPMSFSVHELAQT